MSYKKSILNLKQKAMIEALKSQLGVVTAACSLVKIDRSTHYAWLKDNYLYRKEVSDIPEITHDFVENALLKQIKEGNPSSTQFYLKTKGKVRGYIDKHEIEHQTTDSGFKLIIKAKDGSSLGSK